MTLLPWWNESDRLPIFKTEPATDSKLSIRKSCARELLFTTFISNFGHYSFCSESQSYTWSLSKISNLLVAWAGSLDQESCTPLVYTTTYSLFSLFPQNDVSVSQKKHLPLTTGTSQTDSRVASIEAAQIRSELRCFSLTSIFICRIWQ